MIKTYKNSFYIVLVILSLTVSSLNFIKLIPISNTIKEGTQSVAPKESILESNKVVYGFWPYWMDPSSYQPNWNALTHVAYFSWGANSDGSLTPPDVARFNTVKNLAQQNDAKLTICITCFSQDTQDNILAYHKTDFSTNILNLLQTYGVDGINLDFEFPRTTNSYTGESNTILFENLMSILHTTLKNANINYHLSFCIAGSVESIYRNEGLSQYIDAIFLMGYDYHWRSASTTGAVSPYDDPTQLDVVDSVNRLIAYYPSDKIILGFPFYGYDWPCSSEQPGASVIESGSSVLLKDAILNAQSYGRLWDSNSNTPWYRYQSGSTWHQCWYDDEISLDIKFDYVNSANLAGTGFWALGYETSDIWNLVLTKFSDSQNSLNGLSGKIICVDAGHGGSDSGTVGIDGSGYPNEKDFNLDTALRLKDLLISASATVIMTRETDVFISLSERCTIANNNNADIFVSVHHNAASSTSARGTETLYWAESDTIYSVNGRSLASNIQSRLVAQLGTTNRGIKGDYPYLGYHLYVLANTDMPAALTENAFLSNQDDFNLINNPDNRYKAALGIYEGICNYFGVDPEPPPPDEDITDKTIIIDPGDGGSESGPVGIDGEGFPNEKDFNLDVSLRLKDMLSYIGANVILTRETDIDVSLSERCNIANINNADIFVSIHHNAASSSSAGGTETFYWAESDIVYSINGRNLAGDIQSRLISQLGTTDRGIRGDYPYLGSHFEVLDNTNMPAILTEILFLTNQDDFNLISDPNSRIRAALAIYEGICNYFGADPQIPQASDITISGYPSSSSYISRTIFFEKSFSNTLFMTRASLYLDESYIEDFYFKEWFFNTESTISQPILNSYDYSIGWHNIKIITQDLWGIEKNHEEELFFQRSPIVGAKIYGSSDAANIADNDDESYGSNDLNKPLYIELPCNFNIWAIKTHWWDNDNRYYQYKIETSTDNETWVLQIDKTLGEYKSWQWDAIDSDIRWIRIIGIHNSENEWWHLKEIHLFTPLPQQFRVFGEILNSPFVIIENLSNEQVANITVIDDYYIFDLSNLNFIYGDEICVSVPGENCTFIVTDPYTSKKIDLGSLIDDKSKSDNFDPIFISITIGLLGFISLVTIVYLRKKAHANKNRLKDKNMEAPNHNSSNNLINNLSSKSPTHTNLTSNNQYDYNSNQYNNPDYSNQAYRGENHIENSGGYNSDYLFKIQGCPRCGAGENYIEEILDKNYVESYYPEIIYAKKRICRNCGFED